MTRTGTFALPLLLACSSVHAQQVIYTCAGKAGTHVLQDTPCAAGGQPPLAVRRYAIPHDPPDAARRLALVEREVHAGWAADRAAAQPRYRQRVAGARQEGRHADATHRDRQRARCALARAQLEDAAHSRRPRRDRGQLEDEAVDACFAL